MTLDDQGNSPPDNSVILKHDGEYYRTQWKVEDFLSKGSVITSPEFQCGNLGITMQIDFESKTESMHIVLKYRYLVGKMKSLYIPTIVKLLNKDDKKTLENSENPLLGDNIDTIEFFFSLHLKEITEDIGFLDNGCLTFDLSFRHKNPLDIYTKIEKKLVTLPNNDNTYQYNLNIYEIDLSAQIRSEIITFNDIEMEIIVQFTYDFIMVEMQVKRFGNGAKPFNYIVSFKNRITKNSLIKTSQSDIIVADQIKPIVFSNIGKSDVSASNGWIENNISVFNFIFIVNQDDNTIHSPETPTEFEFFKADNDIVPYVDKAYTFNWTPTCNELQREEVSSNAYLCDNASVKVLIKKQELVIDVAYFKGVYCPFTVILFNNNNNSTWEWSQTKYINPNTVSATSLPVSRVDLLYPSKGWVNSTNSLTFMIKLRPSSRLTQGAEPEQEMIPTNNVYQLDIKLPTKCFETSKHTTPNFIFNDLKFKICIEINDDNLLFTIQLLSSRVQFLLDLVIKAINSDAKKSFEMKKTQYFSYALMNACFIISIPKSELMNQSFGWIIDQVFSISLIFKYRDLHPIEVDSKLFTKTPYEDYSKPSSKNYQESHVFQSHNDDFHRESYESSYRSYCTKSKEETGYVGLENQGATCYMNSMLQSLYHIPAFRRIVYNMPTTGTENINNSIPLNLQKLFSQMQFSNTACSTKSLTKSFGWGTAETFMQHDVQEFCRVLLDNLITKMKGTELEESIQKIFRGKTKSFIRCINVECATERIEEFYDLSLVVKGCKSLQDSLALYCQSEKLDGNNQYETDDFGKQDAYMGVEFYELPPVLQLHLRRFEYDFTTNSNVKIHDRFEFPPEIDLSRYLSKDSPDLNRNNMYELYGVLVHSGGSYGGHYYAFLRTSTDKQWYKFNDSQVTKESDSTAIEDNYGNKTGEEEEDNKKEAVIKEKEGTQKHGKIRSIKNVFKNFIFDQKKEEESTLSEEEMEEYDPIIAMTDKDLISHSIRASIRHSSNKEYYHSYSGYFLVYVRKDEASSIFEPIQEEDVPEHIKNITSNLVSKNKVEEGATTSTVVKTYQVKLMKESYFVEACAKSIIGYNDFQFETKEMESTTKLSDLYKTISTDLDVPLNTIRLWKSQGFNIPNELIPNTEDKELRSIGVVGKDQANIFVQMKAEDEKLDINSSHAVIYVKLYCSSTKIPIHYLGSYQFAKETKFSGIIPKIAERNKWMTNDMEFDFYKENINSTNSLSPHDSLAHHVDNGAIIIIQFYLNYQVKPNVIQYLDESTQNIEISSLSTESNVDESELPVVVFDEIYTDKKYPTIDLFYKTKKILDADLYAFEDKNVPICTLKFPSSLVYADICDLIANSTGIDFDSQNDCIALFRMINGKLSLLNVTEDQTLFYYLNKTKNNIYFKLVNDAKLSDLKKMILVTVQYSKDAQSISNESELFIPKGLTCEEVFQLYKSERNIETSECKHRFIGVSDCLIEKIYYPEKIFCGDNKLRIEIIPSDQMHFPSSVTLLPCSFGSYEDEELKAINVPFVFPVIPGELFKESKERMINASGLTKEAIEQIKFIITIKPSFRSGKIIRDTDVLSTIINSHSILFLASEIPRVKSLSKSTNDTTYSKRSQSVKIYN